MTDWARPGDYYWTHGPYTICKVVIGGKDTYELWVSTGQCLGRGERSKPLRDMVDGLLKKAA